MELGKQVERAPRQYGEDNRTKSDAQRDNEAKQVFEMAVAGMRHDQIAEALNISLGTVTNRRRRGAEMAVVPNVEQYRKESAARIDGLFAALLRDNPKATPRVIEAAMALELRRAKLYGTDAPVKIESTVTQIEGGIDAEVARLAEEMGLSPAPAGETVDT